MSFRSGLKSIGKQIWKSNNRSLGTLFGCMAGCIMGTILVIQHSASISIVGNPSSLPYQIIGILLAAGTGGNLSSYIGASIDILTGEKTLFNLVEYLYHCCYPKESAAEVKEKKPAVKPPQEEKQFPIEMELSTRSSSYVYMLHRFTIGGDQLERLYKENMQQCEILKELKQDWSELKNWMNKFQHQQDETPSLLPSLILSATTVQKL